MHFLVLIHDAPKPGNDDNVLAAQAQHTEEERARARQDRAHIELFFIHFFLSLFGSSLISGHLGDWNRAAKCV